LSAAVLLAAIAAQNSLLDTTEAQSSPQLMQSTSNSAITACAAQGDRCSRTSLGSTPGTVMSHAVLQDACPQSDLHVLKYVPEDSTDGRPLVATWCG